MRLVRLGIVFFVVLVTGCQNSAPKFGDTTTSDAGGIGSDVGSAGENPPREHLAAWFTGRDRKIKVCFEIAPGFGASEEQARASIRRSFALWQDYIERKGIYRNEPPEFRLATQLAPWSNDPARAKDPKNFLPAHCDGSEDLKFYLGIETPQVTAEKRKFLRPVGFAKRTQFDIEAGWGKGYIWIASGDWSVPNRLNQLLLHEVGHVFGNDHIAGTIMAADIINWVRNDSADWGMFLSAIDNCRELAPCEDCEYRSSEVDLEDWDKAHAPYFEKLTGPDWSKKFSVVATRLPEARWSFLELVSEEAPAKPPLKFNLNMADSYDEPAFESGLKVFKLVRGVRDLFMEDQAFVQSVVAVRDGQELAYLTIDYNMASCPLNVWKPYFNIRISMVESKRKHFLNSFYTMPDLISPRWKKMPMAPYGLFRKHLNLPELEE